MKTETHFDLGLKICKEQLKFFPFYKKALFVLGCVLPDFDPFSYLKGFKIRPFFGHNWANAKKYIFHSAKKVKVNGVGLRLGLLVHYVCDAFTFVHNNDFNGGLREHTQYEKRLHDLIIKSGSQICKAMPIQDAVQYIETWHKKYEEGSQSLETDVQFILSACFQIVELGAESVEAQTLGSRTAER